MTGGGGGVGEGQQTSETHTRRAVANAEQHLSLVQQTSHTNVCLSAVRLKSVSVSYYDLAAE